MQVGKLDRTDKNKTKHKDLEEPYLFTSLKSIIFQMRFSNCAKAAWLRSQAKRRSRCSVYCGPCSQHVHAVRHHKEGCMEIELPSVVMTKAFPNDTGLPVVMCR